MVSISSDQACTIPKLYANFFLGSDIEFVRPDGRPEFFNADRFLSYYHSMTFAVNQEGQALLPGRKLLAMELHEPFFESWDPRHENPCKWTGVICSLDHENLVTEINIQSVQIAGNVPSQFAVLGSLRSLVISAANLTGSIPAEIGGYESLEILDLSGNRLRGNIPAEISKLKNLKSLILNSNQLQGSIPAEIGNCHNLVDLVVFDNQLSGKIPAELGRLANLEVFRAGGNENIEGTLPDELSNCTNLVTLGLAETNISGKIPLSFGSLKKLQTLAIYTAFLSGTIPAELGNCSELVNLYLYENRLSGAIPRELGKLQKLEKLYLWDNELDGSIPAELGSCSSLKFVDLSTNSLSGSIPDSFGSLKNLSELEITDNNVSGSIPAALANCTELTQIQLYNNQISGQMPAELGALKKLTVLFLWQNNLEGPIPSSLGSCDNLQSLDLSHNRLTGSIPPSLFEIKNLTKLLLLSNELTGALPPEIGNCVALSRLRLGNNRLLNQIPREIGKLENLVFLDLAMNQFSGSIPAEIGGCSQLQMLDLHGNRLGGELPRALGFLHGLQVVDLSANELTGLIPANLGNLVALTKLTLNGNALSGAIPWEISRCTNLQLLDLSLNRFSGQIPPEMGKCKRLEIALNLSWNNLSGSIPAQFSGLTKLASLDLSHNLLSGNLSALAQLSESCFSQHFFQRFFRVSARYQVFSDLCLPSDLSGNAALCTSEEVCFMSSGAHFEQRVFEVKLVMILLFSVTAVMMILGIWLVTQSGEWVTGKWRIPRSGGHGRLTTFQKLNFSADDVVNALVDSNIIGKGCSGVVYKAEMGNGDVIAVKKLWTGKESECEKVRERDSFSAEVNTLGAIRHRNIVRLLGCCTNGRSKLLMYDYMPNGSLGGLLHEKRSMLDWEIRYNIVLGVRRGLSYLHHDCRPPILHRDVKANNILLGSQYEPYLADFGLAKLVDSADFNRSSTTVAGSYGYIAPEYGYTMKITQKIDVYSFGVVLLEVVTGKQPIDPTIPEGVHLVEWARDAVQSNKLADSAEVIDPRLQGRPDTQIQEMLQVLGVAFLCVNSNPDERPTMKDVAALLKEIRHDCHDYNGKADLLLKQTPAPGSTRSPNPTADARSPVGSSFGLEYSSASTTAHESYSLHSSVSNVI
uniref:Receptor protein kinase n=1 Tax=Pinus sylvestris TaxID=3349 RepID=Q9FEU2_PINSY|nr:receptor protein kinase [Pinus sylvestris]